MRLLFCLITLAFFCVESASAGVTFNFISNPHQNVEGNVILDTTGTRQLRAFGAPLSGVDSSNQYDAYRTPFGLGIDNNNVMPDDLGPVQMFQLGQFTQTYHVDGKNGGETLKLYFDVPNRQLQIDSIHFCLAGVGEQVIIRRDDPTSAGFVYNFQASDMGLIDLAALIPDPLDRTAKRWFFTAARPQDEWNIERIQGEVVPEPATIAIWSAFGVGLVVCGRRRQRDRKKSPESEK